MGGGVVYQGCGATWDQVVLEGLSEEVVPDVRSEMRGESQRRICEQGEQHVQRGTSTCKGLELRVKRGVMGCTVASKAIVG